MARKALLPGRRPRLLILTPDFPPAPGGIQAVAHRLAAGIGGFETRVVTLDADDASQFDRLSPLDVVRARAGPLPRGARNVLLNGLALGEALRFRPHVVLSMHAVVSPAASAISRALGARTVQYFYAEEITARPKLAAFAAREADEVIAISDYTARLVAETGARPASVRLIPPGVDLPADPTPLPTDHPTVLTIARIEERYKGHDQMVRALSLVVSKIPEAQWVVIGDGSLRPGLEQLAHSYGLTDSIAFLGAVADEQRDTWLRRAQVLAMPSRLPAGRFAGEGFGIVYLEAGAYGKPVVAGNVGGALDAVLDGETGLLVDPLDPLALAEAITTLLLDRELALRLGAAGQARAQRYAWGVIVERVERVLLEQLGESRGGGDRARTSEPAQPTA